MIRLPTPTAPAGFECSRTTLSLDGPAAAFATRVQCKVRQVELVPTSTTSHSMPDPHTHSCYTPYHYITIPYQLLHSPERGTGRRKAGMVRAAILAVQNYCMEPGRSTGLCHLLCTPLARSCGVLLMAEQPIHEPTVPN